MIYPEWNQQPRQQNRETEQMAAVAGIRRRSPRTSQTVEIGPLTDLTLGELRGFLETAEMAGFTTEAAVTITTTAGDRPHESATYSITAREQR